MTEKEGHPRVLIEDWFPYEEVGIECQRERTGEFIPINRLHTWWARRPLIISRAAIISSLLMPMEDSIDLFFRTCKIDKNLKKEWKKWNLLKKQGEIQKGISTERAFSKNLSKEDMDSLYNNFKVIWGKDTISLLDPMAGGGSIPFEAEKIGLRTIASDINPVASIIQHATIKYPRKYGNSLINKIQQYQKLIIDGCQDLLEFFPKNKEKEFDAFLWVRTVKCVNPECELDVPLSPNWDLTKKPPIIVRVHPPKDLKLKKCVFKVIENPTKEEIKNNKTTIKGGAGICPRCGNSLDSDYIKNEAHLGRMGHQLMAVVYKESIGTKKAVRKFRAPNDDDLNALKRVDSIIEEKSNVWRKNGLLPDEDFPKGCDNRPLYYGMEKWYKFFNNRQLLTNITILEQIIRIKKELLLDTKSNFEEIKAIFTYFQFGFDKIVDYNCIGTRWHNGRSVIANKFDRHDFAFKWSYAEMDIVRKGFNWAMGTIIDAYKELIQLLNMSNESVEILLNPCQNLDSIKDKSIDIIVVDPPYYDNVMYAELSDFFYVWMKRGLSDLYPQHFKMLLTDKDNEAVANQSRFEDLGTSKKELAKQDYEAKMRASFKEMHRILQEHGVLTIMFTHKATDAWDTLATSLMDANFEITASWPVPTEAINSLHIAKKNAVQTTILLVCRKRLTTIQDVWWEDDVLPKIKEIVKKKSAEFQKSGVDGVDLFITVFGPALHEFSKYYPVKDISGNVVRPEKALDVAREIVTDIIYKNIIKSTSTSTDLVSKFYLIAWHLYKAREFPFDEARNLALSIGINVEDLKSIHKILNKKSSDVEIISPTNREKQGFINLENPDDNGILVNAVHLALLSYQAGGQKSFETMIAKLRRDTDKSFRQYLDALYNAIPDVKDLEEKRMLAEILVSTPEKIVPKGGKIDDYLADPNLQTKKPRKKTTSVEDEADEEPDQEEGEE